MENSLFIQSKPESKELNLHKEINIFRSSASVQSSKDKTEQDLTINQGLSFKDLLKENLTKNEEIRNNKFQNDSGISGKNLQNDYFASLDWKRNLFSMNSSKIDDHNIMNYNQNWENFQTGSNNNDNWNFSAKENIDFLDSLPGKEQLRKIDENLRLNDKLNEDEKKVDEEYSENFQERMLSLLQKFEAYIRELKELQSSQNKESESLKSFLSQLHDKIMSLKAALADSTSREKLSKELKGFAEESLASLKLVWEKIEKGGENLTQKKFISVLRAIKEGMESIKEQPFSTSVAEKLAQQKASNATEQILKEKVADEKNSQENIIKNMGNSLRNEKNVSHNGENHNLKQGANEARGMHNQNREGVGIKTDQKGQNNPEMGRFNQGQDKGNSQKGFQKSDLEFDLFKSGISEKISSKAGVAKSRSLGRADIRNVIDQLIQKAKMFSRGQERFRFTANLKPQWLGKVLFQVDYDRGDVMGKFIVQTSELKEILQNNLNVLKKELLAMGVEVKEFEVLLQDNDKGSANQAFANNNADKQSYKESYSGNLTTENVEEVELENPGKKADNRIIDMRA